MVDTSFQVPPEKVSQLARPLTRDPDTGEAQSVPDRAEALRFECGGGGLASTTLDYLRFAQMLLAGGVLGETRILGRKTVEAMRTNRMTPNIANRIAELIPSFDGYGFGLTVAVRESANAFMVVQGISTGTAPGERSGGPIQRKTWRRSSWSRCPDLSGPWAIGRLSIPWSTKR